MPKKNLVIVESPAKAKTLEKFLGEGFKVLACGGHVRDLPKKKLGVNIKKDFEPKYQTIKGKEKIINSLKGEAKKAALVFLAPDPDREGEAIAWHLMELLGDGKIKRIEFNEITKNAVQTAVKNPRSIDMARVEAQQARRILDRIVGYKLSPLLWKKIRKGLSAGRVQSVAVRLICEREKAIEEFKPVEYWTIIATLSKQEGQEFQAKLIQKKDKKVSVSSETEAQKITEELKKNEYKVSRIERKERGRHPAPPFITSTLQQEASRRLGFSASKTMKIAQQLYEGVNVKGEGRVGIITYMRTDSVRIAKEALTETRTFIEKEYGTKYLPKDPKFYKRKKQAQDAHEAIRPTKALRKPEGLQKSLTPDQFKLYSIIWSRFVACQMQSARFDQTSIDISCGDYILRATGSILKFDGFMKLYIESKEEGEGEEKEGLLPELKEGEILKLSGILPEQHFTQPPPRYTEATLVKELEQKGIGRPSTYAPILSTIVYRGYVLREGKALKPTELGNVTNEQLTLHFPKIISTKFTAHMEDGLDDIVAKKIGWVETLEEFYEPFEESLKKAEVRMKKIKKEKMLDETCPECGKKLMIRSGRFGDFIACSGYPKCKFTKDLPSKEGKEIVEQKTCEKCGKPMTIKHSRYGDFLACTGYPKCKNIVSILKKIGVECPKPGCGGDLIVRRSKKGRVFYGCSNYPKCKFALWNKPLKEKCPKCGSILVEKNPRGKLMKKCSSKKCDYYIE